MSRKSLAVDFAMYFAPEDFKIEISHYAEPNSLGMIAIVVVTASSQQQAHARWGSDHGGLVAYIVTEDLRCEGGGYMDPIDNVYDDRVEAERHYNKLLWELQNTPNWDAQAEYDRQHNTINGYDPGVLAWQELMGDETGY